MNVYAITYNKTIYYVLAWTLTESIAKWQGTSSAWAKAQPEAVSLAIESPIGAPTKKDPAPKGWETADGGAEGTSAESLGLLAPRPRSEEEMKHRHSSI